MKVKVLIAAGLIGALNGVLILVAAREWVERWV